MRESSIASTARQLSEVCRHQSGSSFPIVLQVWLRFYQKTCLLVAAGKHCGELVLQGSRNSGAAPAGVSPGSSHADGA